MPRMSFSCSTLVMSTRSSEKSLHLGGIRLRKRELLMISQFFLLAIFSIICVIGIVMDATQGKRPSERWVFMFLGICCVLLPSPVTASSKEQVTHDTSIPNGIYIQDISRNASFATV